MIQYIFEHEEHAVTPAPHGNSKKQQAPSYIRTKESTLNRVKAMAETGKAPKEIYHSVSQENGGLMSAGSVSDLPRNSEQTRCRGSKEKRKTDSLAIMLEECKRQQLTMGEDQFIREVAGGPEFKCVLGFNWQLKEIENFCTNPQGFCIFTADPTFNLGPFNLTVTTYRHLKLLTRRDDKHPTMIGPLLLSQRKAYDTYNFFFSKLAGLNPNIRGILAFGTDGEEGLIQAMSSTMNYAIQLRCFGHFRDNCKAKLRESNVPEQDQKDILCDIFGRNAGDVFEKGIYCRYKLI